MSAFPIDLFRERRTPAEGGRDELPRASDDGHVDRQSQQLCAASLETQSSGPLPPDPKINFSLVLLWESRRERCEAVFRFTL